MLTRPALKFVFGHIGSNYLCSNLGMGSLALKNRLLTLSAHAREGYSSHFVCLSVCLSAFLLWRRRRFQG